jgi:hypothetical protein
MALTALGLVNPFLAIFGRTTATMQEKKILEEMKAQGVPLPEVDEDSISYKIGSFFSNLFGKDEKEVVKTIRSGAPTKSLIPKDRPLMTDEERRLIAGMDAVAGAGALNKDALNSSKSNNQVYSDVYGRPGMEQIDLSGMGADGARPSVQTDIAAGLGSRGYRSEEDIIEKQRKKASEDARKDRKKRKKYQKANRDRTKNKLSSKDRVKDYESGGQKFRGQGGR